jgi:hypothetical protein
MKPGCRCQKPGSNLLSFLHIYFKRLLSSMLRSTEYGTGPSRLVKDGNFMDYMSDCQRLQEKCIPSSWICGDFVQYIPFRRRSLCFMLSFHTRFQHFSCYGTEANLRKNVAIGT